VESFELVILPSVLKDLKKIPKHDVEKILLRIESLVNNPRPPASIKLAGDEKYRIRQGNYRILYRIEDAKLIVIVVKVAHRKDVYN
jgi:mRNA interferase RelE/StbE